MSSSTAFLGKAGAGSDSKGGGRDGQRRRKTEIDGKLWKNECLNDGHFDIFAHALIVKEQNKGGKRCKMMPIYKKMVYNPWPLDREEAVANLVQQ